MVEVNNGYNLLPMLRRYLSYVSSGVIAHSFHPSFVPLLRFEDKEYFIYEVCDLDALEEHLDMLKAIDREGYNLLLFINLADPPTDKFIPSRAWALSKYSYQISRANGFNHSPDLMVKRTRSNTAQKVLRLCFKKCAEIIGNYSNAVDHINSKYALMARSAELMTLGEI